MEGHDHPQEFTNHEEWAPATSQQTGSFREMGLTPHQEEVRNSQLERLRQQLTKAHRSSAAAMFHAKIQRESQDFDNVHAAADGGHASRHELKFIVHPWAMWLLGSTIVIGTTIFIASIKAKHIDDQVGLVPSQIQPDHVWWKYVVGFIVYAFGLILIANGKLETLVLNNLTGKFMVRSYRPLCLVGKLRRERQVHQQIRDIVDVRVEATGEFSGEIDTRSYQVTFEFANGVLAKALESRSKRKTQRRCRMIRQFLGTQHSSNESSRSNDQLVTSDYCSVSDSSSPPTFGGTPNPLADHPEPIQEQMTQQHENIIQVQLEQTG